MEMGTLFRLLLFNFMVGVKAYLSNSPHIITFWGQDPALQEAEKVERALNKTCGSKSSYSTVVLGFVSKSIRNKTTASLPPMHCVKSTKSRSKLSLYCPEISKKVEQCRQNKKKVLIGVGGPNETLYFDDPKSAQYFAKKIWNWFLGGTEISDMRPFGGISLDGVNIFLKDDKSRHVDVFLQTLDKLRKRVADDTKYVYTMSVPCNAPEAYFGDGKNRLSLEKVVPIVKQIYVRYSGKQCCKTGPKHFRGELQEWKRFSINKDRPALFVLFPRSPHKTMTNCFSSNRQLNILHNIIILKRKLGNYISKRKFEYLKYLSCYVQQLANGNPPYFLNMSASAFSGKKSTSHPKSAASIDIPREFADETFTKLDVNKPDFSSLFASHVGHNVLPSLTLPMKYKSVPVKMKSVLGFERPEKTLIDPEMNLDFLLNFGKSFSGSEQKPDLSGPLFHPDAQPPESVTQDTTQRAYDALLRDAQLHETQQQDTQQQDTQQQDTQPQVTDLHERFPSKQSAFNKSGNIVQQFMDENFANTPLHSLQVNDQSSSQASVVSPSLWNLAAFRMGLRDGNLGSMVSGEDGNKIGHGNVNLGNMGYDTYTHAMDGISNILQKYSTHLPALSALVNNGDNGNTPKGDPNLNNGYEQGFANTPRFAGEDTLYRDEAFKSSFMSPKPDELEKEDLTLENIVSPDSNSNPHSTHADHMDDIPNILEKLEKYITTEMQSKNKSVTEPGNSSSFVDNRDDDDNDYEDTDGGLAIKRSEAIDKIGAKRTLKSKKRDSCFDPRSKSVYHYGQNLLAIKLVKKLLKRNLELFNRDLKKEGSTKKRHLHTFKKHAHARKRTEKKKKRKEEKKKQKAIEIPLETKKYHHRRARKNRVKKGKKRTMPLLTVTWNDTMLTPNPEEEGPPSYKSMPRLDDISSQRMRIPGGQGFVNNSENNINTLVDLLLVMSEHHDSRLTDDKMLT